MTNAELIQKFGHLEGMMAAIIKQLSEADKDAAASRAKIYTKVDHLMIEMQDTKSRVKTIEQTLDQDVRPVVQSVTDWKARAAGGLLVIGIIGSVLTAAVWSLWELILEGLRNHLGGR